MDAARRTRLITTLARILQRIPVSLAVPIASAVGAALSSRDSTARRTVERNVTAVLRGAPDAPPPPPALVRRFVRRNFATYARYWAEGATLPAVRHPALVSAMTIAEGDAALRAAVAAGRGVVVALPHIGSWEWGGAFLSAVGIPMTVVAERLEPEELFQFFVDQRAAMGLEVVPLDEGAARSLSKVLASGGIVGLLCDRDLQGGGQPATLFGEDVTIPKGPATLALRSGAALFAAAVYSGPDGSHYAVIEGPLDCERRDGLRSDVARVTAEVARTLEGLIARTPDQWHVFQPIFAEAP